MFAPPGSRAADLARDRIPSWGSMCYHRRPKLPYPLQRGHSWRSASREVEGLAQTLRLTEGGATFRRRLPAAQLEMQKRGAAHWLETAASFR